jgi:protein-S-isoprenylcysteine O-methyltransferase Ste14
MATSGQPANTAGVVAPPPLIFLGPLIAGLLLQRVRPVAAMPEFVARLLGVPLLFAGGALAIWGFRTMGAAGTPVNPREPVQQLVTDGPFSFTRNPLYTALTLAYLGVTCLANAFWPLLFLPGVLAVIRQGIIAREERYLEQLFGDAYRDYKERVPRWF